MFGEKPGFDSQIDTHKEQTVQDSGDIKVNYMVGAEEKPASFRLESIFARDVINYASENLKYLAKLYNTRITINEADAMMSVFDERGRCSYNEKQKSWNIGIDVNFDCLEEIPELVLHEIGHVFSKELDKLFQKNGVQDFNKKLDGQGYPDLFAVYILHPQLFEKYSQYPKVQTAKKVLDEFFQNKEFGSLREMIEDKAHEYRKEKENKFAAAMAMQKELNLTEDELRSAFCPWTGKSDTYMPFTVSRGFHTLLEE